ncbi:hypothetical protein N7I30_20005 [Aurantimonas litoralis]|nr:hypothetical protein [Aurantimonas litoralis]
MAARELPRGQPIGRLSDVEFRVFSQWGEDGIIEWLVGHLDLEDQRFVEFGVETFREANCRFLLHHRNWKGLVMDGSAANMATLSASQSFWKHDLTAETAFVTAENIDDLLEEAGFTGPIGILSIDVDGNDYWIWKAVTSVSPAIVICEVNPVLGDTTPLTVPYEPHFDRFAAHHSGLCFGASIAALKLLAEEKGYVFAGTGASGVNAFFLRRDLAQPVMELIVTPYAWPSQHRDSRDRDGRLTFVGGAARGRLIADCSLVNPQTGERLRFGDVLEPYSSDWLRRMG